MLAAKGFGRRLRRMTADQRRRAVKAMLAEQPGMSQRAIAERLGTSQASVARDIAALRESSGESSTQPVAVGVSAQPSRGDSLVAAIVAEMKSNGLEPDSREEELLNVARRLADRLEVLDQLVARDGVSRKLKDGTVRLHPGLAESRQIEAVLTRCLAGVQLEESYKNPTKQRAANARWSAHRLKAVSRGER